MLWLVLSRSGFCSTDRFHGNGPTRVFLFWSKAGKFKICNQDSEKKVWKLSFFTLKLPAEAKKIEIFPKFQRWMKTNIFKWKPPEVHFTIRNGVPYNKLLTNRACLGRTGEYWPSVVFVRTSLRSVRTVTTSGQYSPVRPSRSVSNILVILRNLLEFRWSLPERMLPYKSLEIFSASTVLSHGSIMLPPHQPRVFARLARWVSG